MGLFVDEIYVDISQRRATIHDVAPVLTKSYNGYRKAKREAFKIMDDPSNNYDSADFYTADGEFLKTINT